MALDSTSSRSRSITAIGAFAVLSAVLGYLLLNKNKKQKSKKPKNLKQIEQPEENNMPNLTNRQPEASELQESLCPVEASSPVLTNEDKFFTEKSEIFEISIEKTTEKNLIFDFESLKQVSESLEQIVPEVLPSSELAESSEPVPEAMPVEEITKSSTSSSTSEISSESANLSSSSYTVSPPSEAQIENFIEEKIVEIKREEKPVPKKVDKPKKQQPEKKVEIQQPPKPKKSKSTSQNLSKAAQKQPLPKSQTVDTISNKKIAEEGVVKKFEDLVVYEFNFPRKLCGKLIGKNGVHVDFIRSKTHTQIAVRNDPKVEEQQIVCVSGLLEDVDHALDIIRSRFPVKHYPQISFKPISKPIIYRRYNTESSAFNTPKVLVAPNMYVDITQVPKQKELVDVYVSSVVGPAHVFIQLPKNSTFTNLQKLDQNMVNVYNNTEERVPIMSEPIEYGSICVAPTSYGWHRAMVTSYLSRSEILQTNPDYGEQCGLATIKFLDYGGYLEIPANQLRQLRSDFMVLPFQALECYLDGLCPYEGTEEAGKQFLTDMVRSSTLKAKITDYYEGLSGIKLYLYNDLYDGLDINSELVSNNFAYNYTMNESSLTKSTLDESQHQHLLQQSI